MRTLTLILSLVLVSVSLLAEPIALQSFENTSSDTWAYTANPSGTVPYFWGRTNQVLGGANAQSGSWFWASWLMDPNECSITFYNVSITPGLHHSVNLWYFSRNLDSATDIFQVCVEYDHGTEWTNWLPILQPNTQSWTLFEFAVPIYASKVRLKLKAQYANTNMDKFAHWDNISIQTGEVDYAAPIIYNTYVAQRIDGSKLVDIQYDLFDANNDVCDVTLLLSDNGGASFDLIIDSQNISGDIGTGINPGVGKHIIWDAGAEDNVFNDNQFVYKFVAEEYSIAMPADLIYLPGGTYIMGDTQGAGEPVELPTHSVSLNSFYMHKYLVTQGEYSAIMGSNPASGYGEGDNYPVYSVTWYSALKYCNLLSLSQGLIPCYVINGSKDPGDWGEVPTVGNASWNEAICDWGANSYRLPTEAEWEYAARGATNNPDYLYSGSNDINVVAWYDGNNSPNGTKPVGIKAPNSFGIYDMSGNLFEWGWDWYSEDYYSISPSDNPLGPESGTLRIARGGRFNSPASTCRVAHRNFRSPYNTSYGLGFRVCRGFMNNKVLAPVFDPPGGSFDVSQGVSITCATPDAIIYYTTDGSEPNQASQLYDSPIIISTITTLKAKAYFSNWQESVTVTAIYAFPPTGFVYVPNGTFNMGDTIDDGVGEAKELPVHSVTLNSFYIAKYEIT